MKSAQALSAVQNGEVDIAFARLDDHFPALEVRPIVHDHLVLVLPADHPLSELHCVSLNDLADQSLILFPRRSSPSYFDQITSACRAAGFSPRVDFEVSSVVSQIAYVGCGIGIGMVPSRSMRFGGGDVVFRPLVETINVVSIAAAWDPQRRKDLVPDIVATAAEIGAGSSVLPVGRAKLGFEAAQT